MFRADVSRRPRVPVQDMGALDLVNLRPLMDLTMGSADVAIALIDGPISASNPDFVATRVHELPARIPGTCSQTNSAACGHGTSVASVLMARRGSQAPAICPGCTLLVRPIFAEARPEHSEVPFAAADELAEAIMDCIHAGAQVMNLSVALVRPSPQAERGLEAALDHAARQGVMVVAAAGNQGTLGSTPITRHPWVVPVAACDNGGRPMSDSNLGISIGRRGLKAPGDEIDTLGPDGMLTLSGTSVAVPFVTGTIALLYSEFRGATAGAIHIALTKGSGQRRTSVVPPLLDAWAAYKVLGEQNFLN